jgi:hypothetical protein
MIHTDEDDEFDRIERENAMKGQPYHFDPVFVSVSQRNQVLEEAARLCEDKNTLLAWPTFADAIRGMKK